MSLEKISNIRPRIAQMSKIRGLTLNNSDLLDLIDAILHNEETWEDEDIRIMLFRIAHRQNPFTGEDLSELTLTHYAVLVIQAVNSCIQTNNLKPSAREFFLASNFKEA